MGVGGGGNLVKLHSAWKQVRYYAIYKSTFNLKFKIESIPSSHSRIIDTPVMKRVNANDNGKGRHRVGSRWVGSGLEVEQRGRDGW